MLKIRQSITHPFYIANYIIQPFSDGIGKALVSEV